MDGHSLGKAMGDLFNAMLYGLGVLALLLLVAIGSCSYCVYRNRALSRQLEQELNHPNHPLTEEQFAKLQAELRRQGYPKRPSPFNDSTGSPSDQGER